MRGRNFIQFKHLDFEFTKNPGLDYKSSTVANWMISHKAGAQQALNISNPTVCGGLLNTFCHLLFELPWTWSPCEENARCLCERKREGNFQEAITTRRRGSGGPDQTSAGLCLLHAGRSCLTTVKLQNMNLPYITCEIKWTTLSSVYLTVKQLKKTKLMPVENPSYGS